MKYLVIIEGERDSFSAYSPDLPGCVVAGSSRAEVELLMAEAMDFHIEGMRLHGEPVPEPRCSSVYIEPKSMAS